MNPSDPSELHPIQPRSRVDSQVQRWTIMGAIVLCTLISALLADSLLAVWRIAVDQPVPRGWQWLLGGPQQTFRSQTAALLFGVLLLGFSLGGFWFLIARGIRWIHRQISDFSS